MKTLAKILVLLALPTVFLGFAYAHLNAERDYVVVSKPFVETIHSNDTVDGILSHYYNEANEGVGFNEFKYNTLHLPENKHLLNEHGGLKLLQVGDKLTIVCKIKVSKK